MLIPPHMTNYNYLIFCTSNTYLDDYEAAVIVD